MLNEQNYLSSHELIYAYHCCAGSILSSVWDLIFYTFLESMPDEMVLVHCIQFICGGTMTYYMGAYGLMSKISSNEDRPYREEYIDLFINAFKPESVVIVYMSYILLLAIDPKTMDTYWQ